VLVVDDEPDIIELLRYILTRDYDVEAAADAGRAVEVLASRSIDLVVLDIGLPGGSGLELAQEILQTRPGTAVLMVTGESSPTVASTALDIGAYGYVIKPFSINEMLIAVDNAMHRKRLADENRAMVEQLRELDDAKNTLLAAVSHDLRSPLSGIIGFADVLRHRFDTIDADRARSILTEISDTARRMNDMLQGLLDKDRVEHGAFAPHQVDVAQLVHRVTGAIEANEHALQVECAEGLVGTVDGPMLERIIDNLVRNALKHTPAGSKIWVRVAPDGNGLEAIVEDNGPGIADDLKPLILERYRQGDTTAGGSGVGMSLVKQFAERHGGTVLVEDRPGGGARFRVVLPDAAVGPT
jgi:signal transduction histidine kinase